MDRIARFIVAHAKRILGLTALITIVAALMLFRMEFNADIASFVLEGNETGEDFKALQTKYATADPVNVVAELTADMTFDSKEGLLALVQLRDELRAVEGVGQVASIVPDTNPATGEPISAATIASLPDVAIEAVLDQSPVSSLLLSEDGRHTMLLVVPADDGLTAARNLDDYQPPAGLEIIKSGNPVVFATVTNVLSLILLIIPPTVIALLVLTFFATIGDRRLSVLAIVPAVIGSLWTFGLIFGLGRQVDILTVIVPIFVVVMGSADGLHFVTHFQEEAERTSDRTAQVASALRAVGVPMILTTISTAAGFLSLVATDVEPIRELGLFAAIGITFAGIVSFFSLPAMLSRLTITAQHHDALLGPRVTAGIRRLVATRIPAVALVVILLGFAAAFLPRLDVNPDQLFFFKDDDPVRIAFEETEDLFGGATPLVGEFAFDPADAESELAMLRATSAELETQPGIREVFSVADLAESLPADQLESVLAGSVTLPLGDMVSDDGLRFIVFPAGFDTEDLQGWLDFADARDEIRTLTGMPVVWDEIARLVLRSQVVSLVVAFALVTVLLLAAYRRLRQTFVSLVPIALTVLTLLAFLAASSIQLNLLTAVLSSIVIGVGIDYAIHFVAAIDNARADGSGYVLRAIDKAGRPIAANALGIAVALTALWLSPLKVHSQVSMIMWVSMTVAALTALLVIPALLPRDGVARNP